MTIPVVKRWAGGGEEGLHFWCPGCNESHSIRTFRPGWSWNGDDMKPTIHPSIKVTGKKVTRDASGNWTGEWERDADGNLIPEVCHSFVIEGRIQFLEDCTHALAGKTVDLPPWPQTEP